MRTTKEAAEMLCYTLAELDGKPASKCDDFVQNDEGYIPAYYLSKAFPRESHRS